jgi:type II secretory pathway pseudopilin PulG
MHTLILSTLLFHSLGIVAILLGSALNSFPPARRAARTWELAETRQG